MLTGSESLDNVSSRKEILRIPMCLWFKNTRVQGRSSSPEDPPKGPTEDPPAWGATRPPRVHPAQAEPRPDFGKSGNLEIQKLGIKKKKKKRKLSKSKSMSPKMSARSGSTGKGPSRPHLGPSQVIFSMDRKIQTMSKIVYFPWWPMGLFIRFGDNAFLLWCKCGR